MPPPDTNADTPSLSPPAAPSADATADTARTAPLDEATRRRLRAETSGLDEHVQLCACGAAIMPTPVLDAIVEHLRLEQTLGGYEAHAARADELGAVYDDVAALIGARRHEIALVENATVAWCQAFYALPLEPGDRVLTSEAEYAANYLAFLQRARQDGIVIDVAPSTPDGAVDVAALESMIGERTKLVSLTWMPTNGGLVNPARAVGEVARRHGVPYLLDACQAVGQTPVDVRDLGATFLSATGRKFLRGPRGTGFLYVEEGWIERLHPVTIDMHAATWTAPADYRLREDARRFENWENAYALQAGLGVAARYAREIGLERIEASARSLAERLRAGIATLGGEVRDRGRERSAIVSFTLDGLEPEPTKLALRERRIHIGTSSPSSTRLDAEARALPELLRAAPHYYNTEDEIDRLLDALDELRRGR